jgi:DNA/RNA endonuclease YhcR with UshA esterase domain
MRMLIGALFSGLIAACGAAPVLAQAVAPAPPTPTIAAADAKAHVGQTVTVEGAVSAATTARSGVTFIDIGGSYPDNAFAAVIFADDAGKFPNIRALDGKTVDVSGAVRLYKGKPEIIVSDPAQIKMK